MLIIDLLVVYGLIKQKKWGWYLAVILFIQQSIMQPYWAYLHYLDNFVVVHALEQFIPTLLVLLSLIVLLRHKAIYTKSR